MCECAELKLWTPERWTEPGGLASGGIAAKQPVRVHLVNVQNTTVADLFVLLFDAERLPETDELPADVLPLPANGAAIFSYPGRGRTFKKGLVWAVSVTPDAYDGTGIGDEFWASVGLSGTCEE